MSVVEGFAVQKWMRARGWKREAVANKGDDEQWADLQLIFNHLDIARSGKISLCAIRNALSMVKLSEDPARHTYLSERIISCFHASGHSKSTGGAVDFTQFADVMAFREKGRKFQSLQDELRNEGLAAAKALFANIFRREVVVRGLLDNGGTIAFMCSVFQNLFKAKGLAASLSDSVRKLRLMEEAIEHRKTKELESKRAAQAKQKLDEGRRRRAKCGNTSRYPIHFSASLKMIPIPPSGGISGQDDVAACVSGVVPHEDGIAPQSKRDPDAKMTTAATQRFRGRREQSDLFHQNANSSSSAEVNIRFKREATREASAVLGVHYVPAPPSPTTKNPATQQMANTSGRRGWWLCSSVSGCAAVATNDGFRAKRVTSVVPGGFVRYPPASVRRLRRRRRRPSPAAGLPPEERGKPISGSVASDPDNPENIGCRRRRKDAILKRTPMCRRSAIARLPSWASCENSACDPRQARNMVSGKSADDDRGAMQESRVRCYTDAATGQDILPHTRGVEAAAAAAAAAEGTSLWENERWEEQDYSRFGSQYTSNLSAATPSHSVTTVVTAVVPTAVTYDRRRTLEHAAAGGGQGQSSSNNTSNVSSSSSLATTRDTIHLGEGDAAECHHPAAGIVEEEETPSHFLEPSDKGGKEARPQALRSPRKPENPMGKASSGRRPPSNGNDPIRGGGGGGGGGGAVGGGEHAAATNVKKWRPSPTPWRTPLVVRCMRRPEPGRGVVGIAIQQL